MIIVSHPRSGSSAFCGLMHWALNPSPLLKSGEGTRLSEFVNYGSNGDGNNHGWHFNTFPIVQHFIIDKSTKPLHHKLNVIDERIYDIPVDENWQTAVKEFLKDRQKTPLTKREMLITAGTWREVIRTQLIERYRYIDYLHENNIPFTCKHFLRNGLTHFVDKGSVHYEAGAIEEDLREFPMDPLPDFPFKKYDHIFLLAKNPVRSVMSGAIINNYRLKARTHNFKHLPQDPLTPRTPLPEIKPPDIRNRLGAILALYYNLKHHSQDSTVITNEQLFRDRAVTYKGKTYKFDDVTDPTSEIPIVYSNPIEDYHSNSAEVKDRVRSIILDRYPDIVEKYGLDV